MRARTFARWMLAGGTVAAIALPTAPASAGGGCHEATQGTGPAVVIEHACFTPSIVHVAEGTVVTFENRDEFDHNLFGTGWAIGELSPGGSGRTTFADEGLYPFQCTLHPGMTGTVVVGDGDGPGNGATVTVAAGSDAPASAPPTERGSTLPAAAAGLLVGLGIGAAAVIAFRRHEAPIPARVTT